MLVALIAAAIILLGLSFLDLPGAPQARAAETAQADTAKVRAVHAIPNLGPVDVYVLPAASTAVITSFEYFSTSPYLSLPAGTYTVEVRAAGASPTSTAVLSRAFSVQANQSYSIVAGGSAPAGLAQPPSSGSIPGGAQPVTLTALLDDNSVPAFDSGRVRVAHFSPNVPPVNVQINGTTVITALAFGGAAYLEVPQGIYIASLDVPSLGLTGALSQSVPVFRGEVATYWAIGYALVAPPTISETQALTVAYSTDAGFSRIRAVHGIPDAPPVDVYVDGTLVVEGLSFFDTSRYVPSFAAGDYLVELRAAGAAPTSTALLSRTLSIDDVPFDYSITAIGTLTTTDSAEPRLAFYSDLTNTPPPGQGRFSAVHIAPDAPTVDVFINGTRTLTNVAYRDVRGYLPVPPGTYTVAVAPAGGSPIYTTTASIEAGQSVTLWASGLLTSTQRNARTQFDLRATYDNVANLRVLHAIPAAPPVDVYVDGDRVVTGLAYGENTDYLPLLEGSIAVSVTAANSTSMLFQENLGLNGSGDYTIAAVSEAPAGRASTQQASPGLALFEDENFLPELGQNARLRFVHLAADVPVPGNTAVDVRSGGAVVFDDIFYLQASNYVQLPAGILPFSVTNGAGTATALTGTLVLDPGSVNTIYAIGGGGGKPLQALLVTDRGSFVVINLPLIGRNFGDGAGR
jgi:hypothetical protein